MGWDGVWVGRVPHLTWLEAQPTRLPIEDVHSPPLLQRGAHCHVYQTIAIDVCQGRDGCSESPKGVARIPLQFRDYFKPQLGRSKVTGHTSTTQEAFAGRGLSRVKNTKEMSAVVPRRIARMPPTNLVQVPAPPLPLCVTWWLWKVPALLSRRVHIRKIQLIAPLKVIVGANKGSHIDNVCHWACHTVCRP